MRPQPLPPTLQHTWDALSALAIPFFLADDDNAILGHNEAMGALAGDGGFPCRLEQLFARVEDQRWAAGTPGLAAHRGGPREVVILRPDGERRWVEISFRRLEDRRVRLFAALDTGARRRAEEEAGVLRRRLEGITAASGQVTYECSTATQGIVLGGDIERVFGYAPSDLDGTLEQWSRLIHPEERPRVDALYDEALRAGAPFTAEYRFRHRDGGWVRVLDRGFPLPGEGGRPPVMIGTMQDIGELRRMESALRESEERFRTLVQESSDVVAVYDVEGTFTYLSPSVERVFGYAPAALVGTSAFALLHPDDREPARTAFTRTVADHRRSSPHHFRIRLADGRWAWVETIARNLLDHPQIRGIVVTHRDITERKAAEERMGRLQEQFLQSQKMEAIGRLAGGVAHDFNNLLTSIIGYADMLLRDERVTADLRDGIREIEAAADRAADLTRRLLTFSRKQVLQARVVDLNALVANLQKLLQRMIGEDVTLLAGLDPGAGRVRADPGQLEQAIINLAVNARDAMPGGGTLSIETRDLTLSPGSLPGHTIGAPGRWVLVSVSDTGVGMSDEVKVHLFEPFFTTKEPGRGTGLGLATVYGFVRQSGGHIDLTSAPGRGTCFRIYLPCVEEELSAEPGGQGDPVEQGGTERLLVVEDEAPLLRMILRTLSACGYNAVGAAGADGALALLDAGHAFDLLITDVVMPVMGGVELAREIRRRRPGTRVLYISGYTGGAFGDEHPVEQGAGFLPKPFSLRALTAKVRELLDG
jgi:two-component system, cell cycle sensor histidine kinase and response regulator CckA